MPYGRCEEEEEYEWRFNKLLSDQYLLHSDARYEFSSGEDNLLGLIFFKPSYV